MEKERDFIITDSQIEQLRTVLPNVDELLQKDYDDFLDALDDAMLEALDGPNFEYETKESRLLARLYDEIFAQND